MDGSEPQASRAGLRRPVALLVAAALFMENLDATIIATAAPAMARSLHASASSIGIAVTSYLLSVAVFVPLSGWLTHRFGSRRVRASDKRNSGKSAPIFYLVGRPSVVANLSANWARKLRVDD